MKRVRIGIVLIVLSWLPIAQGIISILHHNNELFSGTSASFLRLGIWCVQLLIGLVGLWLVGKQAAVLARSAGWKHVPANLWHLFWNGS